MYVNKSHTKSQCSPTVAVVCSPRETVDNAGLSTKVTVDEVNDVLVHFLGFLGKHGILQVGTVEALCEPERERRGGSGEGREWGGEGVGRGGSREGREGRMGEEGKRGGRKGVRERGGEGEGEGKWKEERKC